MTRLNITNKSIYKLKKNKNQSKKKVPKKRKYKKRKNRGTSFRKKRKKYNIKKNSIKNYNQKGGVLKAEQIRNLKSVRDEIINAPRVMTIIPFINFDINKLDPNADIDELIDQVKDENKDSFGVKQLPFVINDKKDEPYARAIAQQATKPQYNFNNYYLNEKIKYKEDEMPIFKMIIQRISRYIKHVNEKKKEELQSQINQITDKIKELFQDNTKDKFRNYLKEKIDTLTFIQWLLNLTKNIDNVDYNKEINETTIGGRTLRQLFYLYLNMKDNQSITELATFIGQANTAISVEDGKLDKLKRGVDIIKTTQPLIPCNSKDIASENVKNYLKAAVATINNEPLPPWKKPDESINRLFEELNKNDETQIDFQNKSDEDKKNIDTKKEEFEKSLLKTTASVDENLKKLEELKAKIKLIQEENNKKNGELAEIKKKKAEIDNKEAEKDNKKAQENLQENQEEVLRKDEAFNKAKEENDTSKAELERLKTELSKCEDKLKNDENANSETLNKQKEENQAKIDKLENKLKEQQEQMENLIKEKDELKSKGVELQETSNKASQTAAEKNDELNNAINNETEANNRGSGEGKKEEEGKQDDVTEEKLFGEIEEDIQDEDEPDDGGYFVHVYTDRAGKVRVNVVDGGQGESTQQWIKLANEAE
tara:strand:- start:3124 stop:5088 length:1965 start_codon:yes stop_codon:yes gene_type:complete